MKLEEEDHKISQLEALNEKLNSKLNANNKQIDSLVSKCQDTASSYERKLKTMKDNTVAKE